MTGMTKPKGAKRVEPASLSVVIPFYKDEVYLEDAIRSAIGQLIDDMEIIVVNDNPGPASEAFLAGIAATYPIRVATHSHNRGLSAARNTGIEAARKDFVTFLDADDTFVAGALAKNLAFASTCGSDITHAPTMVAPVPSSMPAVQAREFKVPLGRDTKLFGREIRNTNIRKNPEAQYIVSSWCSIYRRGFLTDKAIRFDEAQRKFEDRLFVLDSVFAADTISFSDIPARNWRRRMGSITTGERAFKDISMQIDLLTKCIESAKAYAGTAADRQIVLQREIHHSISRVLWDVRVLEFDPERTPELADACQRLSASLKGLALRRSVFADLPTLVISHLGKVSGGYQAVTRAMLLEAFEMVRDGRWKDLYEWRRAQLLPRGRTVAVASSLAGKELILHIGLHKTGSTFLQRILSQDRERLKQHGILFPKTGFVSSVTNNQRGEATPGHAGIVAAMRNDRAEVLDQLWQEIAHSGCDRVLISAENFSYPNVTAQERAKQIERAGAYFAAFGSRRAICVVRRPDEYIDRYFREQVFLSNGWSRRSAEQFASELGSQMTDLRFLTEDWRRICDDTIDLISYENARRQGLEHRFYESLGLDAPAKAVEGGATYVSPTAEQVAVGRMIAASQIDPIQKPAALAEFLAATESLPRTKGFELLSRETRLKLLDEFAAKSLPYLAEHDVEVPFDEWRSAVADGPEAPRSIDPRYVDAAIGAMANLAPHKFETQKRSLALSAYRFGKATIGRFW